MFDKIIMNPPYKGSLHLEILDQMLKSFPEAEIANISPIARLKDPFFAKKNTKARKLYEKIAPHIDFLEIISKNISNNLFGIDSFLDLAIYHITKEAKGIDVYNLWKTLRDKYTVAILEKVCLSCYDTTSLNNVVEKNKRDGIRVLVANIAGNRGNLPIYKDLDFVVDGYKNGKDWTLCKNNGGYEKELGSAIPLSIKFETEEEAKNFYDSYKTKFFRFICEVSCCEQHIQLKAIPFLPDYTKKWTDQELYEYFELTEDEIKVVEEFSETKKVP